MKTSLSTLRIAVPVALSLMVFVRTDAFPRPEVVQGAVGLRIDGFGQSPRRSTDKGVQALRCHEVDASTSVNIPIVVRDVATYGLDGALNVSMDRDWLISPQEGIKVSLRPGESNVFYFSALPRQCVLPALYPVHAQFRPFDGKPPIQVTAVVKAVTENRAFAPYPEKLRGAHVSKMYPAVDEETRRLAERRACAALMNKTGNDEGSFLLQDGGSSYGAGFAPGPGGVLDGVFAFTDGSRTVSIKGFECFVDGARVKSEAEIPWADVSVSAERGALKVKWSGRRAKRMADGSPRFTHLAPGAASETISRVYGGFGYVWEKPCKFTLKAGAFGLSTRHAGIDYDNGLSVVMAVDSSPDSFEVDGVNRYAGIVSHNDTAFYFVPSAFGAFDAARRFAAVSGYRASPGWSKLAGRMCLDDWSGLYARESDSIDMAARYGLNDSVYIQHTWQRYGYDVRLPDVYPPKGDFGAFLSMAESARKAGMLFGVHDNFVDYYPDAQGFCYDFISFNPDGTPQEAWFNAGPRDLSYRWNPGAIHPFVRRNLSLARKGFAPTALFLDVFAASFPKDFIDRRGVFHPASETKAEWCRALDECRIASGCSNMVIVSESGNDSLIGHLDAGASDHFIPEFIIQDRRQYAEAERVPWHDAVSHGKMVLLGGGLGSRYCMRGWTKQGDQALHGYATDDYFCTTVIGGRSPMCGGSFGRGVVKTYWMLHDVCKQLAKGDLMSVRFADGIHRQNSVFSTGEVWINRKTNSVWKVNGLSLPAYGFHVMCNDGREAAVLSVDGVRAGFAKSPGVWFLDARPPAGDGRLHEVEASAEAWERMSETSLKIDVRWKIRRPIDKSFLPFVHVVPFGDPRKIAFDAVMTPLPEGDIVVRLPKRLASGRYSVRYGFFTKTGSRLPIGGYGDGTGRVRGGVIEVGEKNGRPIVLDWTQEHPTVRHKDLEINVSRSMVDFGGVRTDGAFRMTFPDLKIIPLPGSKPFRIEMDLKRFGIEGKGKFTLEHPSSGAAAPESVVENGVLKASFDARSFAYLWQ